MRTGAHVGPIDLTPAIDHLYHEAGLMDDPHAALRDAVLQRVLNGPGETDLALRNAAAAGTGLPPELQPLVDKIHAHAYRVTDDDVAIAQRVHGDDGTFEVVVSAALGASRTRLMAGLRALEDA